MKKQILKYLSENARYTNEQLALMLGISKNEVESIVKELEDDGTIIKYTTIINHDKMDDKRVEALIEVKVKPQKLKGFDTFAENFTKFNQVYTSYGIVISSNKV
jgi:DNA-binding Lrp family transcriptional regulator